MHLIEHFNRWENRGNSPSFRADFKDADWESLEDVTEASDAGAASALRGMLRRDDSDADLMLSLSANHSRLSPHSLRVSLRWCCINCRHATFWRQYWWVPLVLVLMLVVYIIVILAITHSLGS